jgi:hypothetical protein
MSKCNCKHKRTRPSYLHDRNTMVKAKIWWNNNLKGIEYKDLDFDKKQNMRIVYGDIFPTSKISDSIIIYSELNKHLKDYKI